MNRHTDIASRVLQDLNPSASQIVIDLGCGDGRWLNAFAKKLDCLCIGVDIDSDRLVIAKQKAFQVLIVNNTS